jgi:hypothetical protein
MELPGGFLIGGVFRRSFRFKPVTGALELALSESGWSARNHPARVTAVLCAALDSLGDENAVGSDLVRNLSVGDRQFLMRRLAAHIDDRLFWLTVRCAVCGEKIDVPVRHSDLPVKPAGEKYPETTVETRIGALRVRVPTGADQEAIADIEDDDAALRVLLARITSAQDWDRGGRGLDVSSLSREDLAAIESTVEAMAPEVAAHVLTGCPYCDRENLVPISPYGCLEKSVGELFSEIHQLAFCYHWSEREILSLPRSRRQVYLDLIDWSRGMHSAKQFRKVG